MRESVKISGRDYYFLLREHGDFIITKTMQKDVRKSHKANYWLNYFFGSIFQLEIILLG